MFQFDMKTGLSLEKDEQQTAILGDKEM